MKTTTLLLATLLLASCTAKEQPKQTTQAKAQPTYYARNTASTVNIIAYDVYGQKTAEGQGFYIAPDVVATPLAWIKGAFNAKITPADSRQAHNVFGYSAVSLADNLVAFRVARRIQNINPIDTTEVLTGDTLYALSIKNKKTLKYTTVLRDDTIDIDLPLGAPLFDRKGNMRALADHDHTIRPAQLVDHLRKGMSESHINIYDLRLLTDKVYPAASRIRGMRIVTTMGQIDIALDDRTPTYRDNFIRLVCDDFYDSLLVHRVLPNYLIQSGAADSKHAGPDDVVGWQGPGYKLPMELNSALFHRRGAVAASKLPQDHNSSNRSDGSQFYIVVGRRFTNDDLTQIEQDYHKHFTPAQREAYTTEGGAPYLDGDYTVFGHVTAGMDVVDRIAAVPLNGDRPQTDIRIIDVRILWK